jgi:hypothetical protein
MIIAVVRPYHGQLQTRFWRCDEMGQELFLEVPKPHLYPRNSPTESSSRGSSAKGITPFVP